MNIAEVEDILGTLRKNALERRVPARYRTAEGIAEQVKTLCLQYRTEDDPKPFGLIRFYDEGTDSVQSYTINVEEFA